MLKQTYEHRSEQTQDLLTVSPRMEFSQDFQTKLANIDPFDEVYEEVLADCFTPLNSCSNNDGAAGFSYSRLHRASNTSFITFLPISGLKKISLYRIFVWSKF